MTEVIIGILKQIGIYDRARAKFDTDKDLADAFQNDFDRLVGMFGEGEGDE